MPDIAAFCGLRYDTTRFGTDQSSLIAPPYDVLNEADKAALIARHDRNIVTIDLPHVPPKTAGPDAVYAQAAETLRAWCDDGTLTADAEPALYVYHQRYTHDGQAYTRKLFFARMRLEPFGTGTVFPHEQTFGGPKEDRLKLMTATQCQLSPIFGLYSDPDEAVSKLLDVGDRQPTVTADLAGVKQQVWPVTDLDTIRAVAAQMANRPAYIADGHHRYGTAMNYRDQLEAAHGPLPDDHPARFVFIGLCAMEDPGCIILPTHRVLHNFGAATGDDLLAAMAPGLDLQPAPADVKEPAQLLSQDARHDVGICMPDGRMFTGTFTNRPVLTTLAADYSDAWRGLDLAYLHRYLIEDLLADAAPKVTCVKTLDETISMTAEKTGVAILTKACTMEELRGVSHAGDLMPQKSTFFYPKLATGLLINPLT